MSDDTPSPLNNVITIDDERIKSHLDRVVRGTVEETLNALLNAEADRLCNAQRYERSEARRDTRAGHYERGLQTKAGEVRLRVPKLRQQTFETAIIERYRRRESSVEEALIEMYLAGVSVRRVEDITEALWGTRVSPSTVSELNKKIYGTIEAWRNRPIEGEHPYVYLDGIVLKRSWAGEVRNVSLLVAIGVNESGYREILGICEGAKEDKSGWSAFLKHLKERGLKGVRLIISDACIGLAESAAEFFPEAAWQRCVVHWYRNIFSHVPSTKVREIAAMLKAIHASEDIAAAREKAMSATSYFFRGLSMPILAARSRFSMVSSTRRHCICPPMQRSAAAASTPSGAPPMPINIDTGYLRLDSIDDAGNVAVCDETHCGADTAHRGNHIGMTRPIQDQGGDVGRVHILGLGEGKDILGHLRIEVHD
jgi:putative transposase